MKTASTAPASGRACGAAERPELAHSTARYDRNCELAPLSLPTVLMTAIDPLDADAIARICASFELEVHEHLDSTQVRARQRVRGGDTQAAAILAEAQSAGRGQRGRVWQSPAAAAIYLTLIWPSRRGLAGLAGLSLMVGLSVRAMLANWGVQARLKWPNDVWVERRKLAGILIDVVNDRATTCALIGIGINLVLPADTRAEIDQPVIDLVEILDPLPSRNLLIGALLRQLEQDLTRFEREGFAAFHAAWAPADALAGASIWLSEGAEAASGQAQGIDELGRLRVDCGGELRLLSAGEIRVRPV
jgi:BirA family transcriptional regulator, biotin operon repressor / biotin---[acetyl-CoA-carboxylase] ligase